MLTFYQVQMGLLTLVPKREARAEYQTRVERHKNFLCYIIINLYLENHFLLVQNWTVSVNRAVVSASTLARNCPMGELHHHRLSLINANHASIKFVSNVIDALVSEHHGTQPILAVISALTGIINVWVTTG